MLENDSFASRLYGLDFLFLFENTLDLCNLDNGTEADASIIGMTHQI